MDEIYDFGKILQKLRKEKGLTQEQLARRINKESSIISRYEKGLQNPTFETVKEFAAIFNVSMDYLLGREQFLTPKDEKDISKILDQTKQQLLSQEGLMFDGDPASPEAIESILSAMQIGMEMAKKKNKEKYTPKKYKKD